MSLSVYADPFHYNNILVGARASGFSGAYTAIADDPSGLFYNPAGIVYAPGNNISGSANALYNTKKIYKDVFAGTDWVRAASSFLPNFFGIIQKFKNGKVGLSYVVPDSILEDQDQIIKNIPALVEAEQGIFTKSTISEYIINLDKNDTTFNVGPSYARKISKSFSMGITLYMHNRKNKWILNQNVNHLTDSGTKYTEWTDTYFDSSEWGIRPIVGIMWSPLDKLSIGLKISDIFVMGSKTSRQDVVSKPYFSKSIWRKIESTDKPKYPMNFTLGSAYFASNSLLFSVDGSYYLGVEDELFGSTVKRKKIWNLAVGTEYYFTDTAAIRVGGHTNNSSAFKIKEGLKDQDEFVNLYGGSMSISYFTKGASLTLGGVYSYGKGKAQMIGDVTSIQDVVMNSWTVFVATLYNY